MNGDLENLSVGQSYFSDQKSNIIRYQLISSARKFSETCLWAMHSMPGEV